LPVCGMHAFFVIDSHLCPTHYGERQDRLRQEAAVRDATQAAASRRLDLESGLTFFGSGEAGRLLRAARVPADAIWVIEMRRQRRLFGQPGVAADVTGTREGWVLGTFTWEWNVTTGPQMVRRERAHRLTALLDDSQGASLAGVHPHANGKGYVLERIVGWNVGLICLKSIADKIRELVDKP
jgi:hypothetical protein